MNLSLANSICENANPIILSGGSPAGGTYSGSGVVSGIFDPSTIGIGTNFISYSYTGSNGCSDSALSSITVLQSPVVTLALPNFVCENTSSFLLSGGLPSGGTYSGSGVGAGSFDPAVSGLGVIPIL